MDFTFSDEQNMLRETVARYVANEYTFAARRKIVAGEAGYSREVWSAFAGMGLLGLPFAEEHGGIGGTPVETMIVMAELGRGIVVEPYFATVVLAGGLVNLAGSDAQKQAILPEVAAGRRLLAAAIFEVQARHDLHDVAVSARRDGAGFRLDGRKSVVLHGAAADLLVVSARTAGGQRDEQGVSLFLVDPKGPGVTVRGYRTIDGQRAADVTFANAALGADALLGPLDGGLPLLERACDAAAAALCAEAVGLMEQTNALTLEYSKQRVQFGQPIGRFQVLAHRQVDMMMHCEQTRSLCYLATGHARSTDDAARRRAVSAAKAHAGISGRAVGESAIQIHGGMGITDEMAVGHYCKRLAMLEQTLGDSDHHLERLAAVTR